MPAHHWRKNGWLRGGLLGFSFLLAVTDIKYSEYFAVLSGKRRRRWYCHISGISWHVNWLRIHSFLIRKGRRSERRRKGVWLPWISHCTSPCKEMNRKKWDRTESYKYQQYVCRCLSCKKPVGAYCRYNVGHWLCQSCFVNRAMEAEK